MIITIFWDSKDTTELIQITKESLKELWLEKIIKVKKNIDITYKKSMWIKKIPAFCLEEKDLDFKDIIFEWVVPSKEEIINLISSIIWWESSCNTDNCTHCWIC